MKLPQLYLRDLFWLVLVCALAVGWWVDRSRLAPPFRGCSTFTKRQSSMTFRFRKTMGQS
jgi:hypothetical protein